MRHKGGNTVELKGVSVKSLLELAVLFFPLSSLLCWLLKDSGCYLHSVSGNSIIWNTSYSFQKCLSGTAGDREIAILVSEQAFQQSVPTSKHRKLAMLPLFPNTSGTVAHSALIDPASFHTPNSKHRDFFFFFCKLPQYQSGKLC